MKIKTERFQVDIYTPTHQQNSILKLYSNYTQTLYCMNHFYGEYFNESFSTYMVILDIWHENMSIRAAFYLLFLEEIYSVISASLFPSQFVMLPVKTIALKQGNRNECKTI